MDIPEQTHEAALAALAQRALTEAELRNKLLRKGFERPDVDRVVARLVDTRVVDDRTLAYNLASRRAEEGRRGPARVRTELLARGIPAELAAEAVAAAFAAEARGAALERAFRRLARGGTVPGDRAGRDRLIRQLLRAGFGMGEVLALLERRGADPDELPSSAEDEN